MYNVTSLLKEQHSGLTLLELLKIFDPVAISRNYLHCIERDIAFWEKMGVRSSEALRYYRQYGKRSEDYRRAVCRHRLDLVIARRYRLAASLRRSR